MFMGLGLGLGIHKPIHDRVLTSCRLASHSVTLLQLAHLTSFHWVHTCPSSSVTWQMCWCPTTYSGQWKKTKHSRRH